MTLQIEVETQVMHSDKNDYSLNTLGTKKHLETITVDIPEDMIEVFRKLWGKNKIKITVEGSRIFQDGEDIS